MEEWRGAAGRRSTGGVSHPSRRTGRVEIDRPARCHARLLRPWTRPVLAGMLACEERSCGERRTGPARDASRRRGSDRHRGPPTARRGHARAAPRPRAARGRCTSACGVRETPTAASGRVPRRPDRTSPRARDGRGARVRAARSGQPRERGVALGDDRPARLLRTGGRLGRGRSDRRQARDPCATGGRTGGGRQGGAGRDSRHGAGANADRPREHGRGP
jgi:hypothetical protein